MEPKRIVTVMIGAFVLICLFGAPVNSNPKDCIPEFIPQSEDNQTVNRDDLVLVFVHGVLGDCRSTWTNQATRIYWPVMAREDNFLNGAHIYVYYYPTGLPSAPSIAGIASVMEAHLSNEGVLDYSQIAFVAHSLGGLVVRKFIDSALRTELQFPDVRFLYLLGTPHLKVELPAAKFLATKGNQLFKDLTWQTPFVPELLRTWQHSPQLSRIPIYCAHEVRPFYAGWFPWAKLPPWLATEPIVEEASARLSCSAYEMPIDANHLQMVKPATGSAPQHVFLRRLYIKTLEGRKTLAASD